MKNNQLALPYYLINVFTDDVLSGNPLAAFILNQPLSDHSMQAIAKQFNLSETVFITLYDNPNNAPDVRIFTPVLELDFAGHPLIGTSFLLHYLQKIDAVGNIMTASGKVSIRRDDAIFYLKTPQEPTSYPANLTKEMTANMLGLSLDDISAEPLWVNTGISQLLIHIKQKEAIFKANPDPILFKQGAMLHPNRIVAYLWHEENNQAITRYFTMHNGSITEDPGTGSACANLGGLAILQNQFPITWQVKQGHNIKRICTLSLHVNNKKEIWVGGQAVLVGEGTISWPYP